MSAFGSFVFYLVPKLENEITSYFDEIISDFYVSFAFLIVIFFFDFTRKFWGSGGTGFQLTFR